MDFDLLISTLNYWLVLPDIWVVWEFGTGWTFGAPSWPCTFNMGYNCRFWRGITGCNHKKVFIDLEQVILDLKSVLGDYFGLYQMIVDFNRYLVVLSLPRVLNFTIKLFLANLSIISSVRHLTIADIVLQIMRLSMSGWINLPVLWFMKFVLSVVIVLSMSIFS